MSGGAIESEVAEGPPYGGDEFRAAVAELEQAGVRGGGDLLSPRESFPVQQVVEPLLAGQPEQGRGEHVQGGAAARDRVQPPAWRCPGRDQPPERLGHRRAARHMQRPVRPGPEDQRLPERGIPSDMTGQMPGKVADRGSKDALGWLAGAMAFPLARPPGEPVRRRDLTSACVGRVPARQGSPVSVLHRRHNLPHRGPGHIPSRSWLSCIAAPSGQYAIRP